MNISSKAILGRNDIVVAACRLVALGVLTLAASACQAPPDPETTAEATTDGSTSSTTIPDECGTGGAGSDYCCQYNSNYCDADTDSTSTSSTTFPDECGTGGDDYCDFDTDTDSPTPVIECECIIDDDVDGDSSAIPSAPTCGEPLCGEVSGSCESYCDETPLELADPAALECALVALRDRTPGILSWSWEGFGGTTSRDGYVLINADGTAVRRDWGWSDTFYSVTSANLVELPSAEYFDACLADPDDRERFDCMRSLYGSTAALCDVGWVYGGI